MTMQTESRPSAFYNNKAPRWEFDQTDRDSMAGAAAAASMGVTADFNALTMNWQDYWVIASLLESLTPVYNLMGPFPDVLPPGATPREEEVPYDYEPQT